jgi:methyl-accepting chemotaxis protein
VPSDRSIRTACGVGVTMLSRMRIAPRLALAFAVPLVFLCVLAGRDIHQKWQTRSEMDRLIELADGVKAISSLVHELQRERGISATVIASKGAQMRAERGVQLARTNEQRVNAAAAWTKLKAATSSDEFAKTVNGAEHAVKQLDAKRAQIDALTLSGPDSFSYFTSTIAGLLSVANEMSKLSTRGDITASMTAHVNFMQGKERAGQERATGAAGLAAGRFDAAGHARMQALAASQAAYLDAFKAAVDAKTATVFERTVSGAVNDTVAKMRQTIVAGGLSGELGGLDAKTWFDTTTARIDLLKKVEDHLGEALVAATGAIFAEASRDLVVLSASIAAALIASMILVLVVARSIVRPVSGLTTGMKELARGNFGVVLPGLDRRDEVGEMAQAVETFKVKSAERARAESEERQARDRAAAEQARRAEEHEVAERRDAAERQDIAAKDAMHKVVREFEKTVGGIIDQVSSASTELEATAASLNDTADATQQRSNMVAAAAEEASTNVGSVAAATEQLTASVNEISKQVQASSRIADQAVDQAQKTDARVTQLSQAAARIGDVVRLITAIAEQTNLLALNATIEAARAGEAGRGFAVVATEVKALAAQTAKATDEIGGQIAGMQTATQESVTAIKEIGGTIGKISEIAAAIASAVEQQGAATREIARNVDEAAKGTTDVSANIVDVHRHASETGSASSEMLASARSLSQESHRLKAEMQSFLTMIRTGLGNRRKADDPNFTGPDRRGSGRAAEADARAA